MPTHRSTTHGPILSSQISATGKLNDSLPLPQQSHGLSQLIASALAAENFRVNVFKPGTGTVTVWENAGGTRSAKPIYTLPKIPLTPGPLMVVIKVAQDQAFNSSGADFWPPRGKCYRRERPRDYTTSPFIN